MNLPHTRHNPIITHVRHALSLDECRSFYVPTTWGGLAGESRPAVCAPASFDLDETDSPRGHRQDVKEVWFPGNHSDVGGGYPSSESVPANNSLRWMVSEAHQCGLNFSEDRYGTVFPRDQDEPVTRRHDEMHDTRYWRTIWWIAERSPRWELRNEPPPPTAKYTRTPAGPRRVGGSLRETADWPLGISIHETARDVYAEDTAPWRDVPTEYVHFVSTSSRISRKAE